MANCPRSAKCAANWTDTELFGFNIRVVDVNAATFFESDSPELPPSTVSEVILNNVQKPEGPLTKDERQFFQYIDIVHPIPFRPGWSHVADFSAFITRMLNYDDEDCLIVQRKAVAFPMIWKVVYDRLDVCLMNVQTRKLLLHIHANKVRYFDFLSSTHRINDELFKGYM